MRACFDFLGQKTWWEGEGEGAGTVPRPLPMLRPCGLFRLKKKQQQEQKNAI